MPPVRVEFIRASKTYDGDERAVVALRDVSLEFRAGTVTALVGRSGCGKTTLLNLAGAMDVPTSGEVLVGGRSTSTLREAEMTALRRSRVGFVFQFFQLLPTLSAVENVELPLLLAGDAHARERALERLRWVDLEGKAAAMPYQLSGGQMQRVAVARAVVHSPDIVLADEPTGNLDTVSGNQVLDLLTRAAGDLGACVIMATHSGEAAARAHVCVRLRDGSVESVESQ